MISTWATANLAKAEIGTGAIMLANRYFMSANNITVMVAVAMSVFIAQFFGAKKKENMQRSFGIGIMMISVLYFVFAMFGLIFAPQIIKFFATTRQDGALMIEHGTTYLRIILLSFIPLSLTTPIAFALRGTKKTLVPMFATLATATTNFVLNILFIYVLDLGIRGAAYSTLIARFIELSVILIYYLKEKPAFYGSIKQVFSFNKEEAKALLKYSVPTGLAQVITEATVIFMLFSYARIDAGNSTYISAVTISQSVVDLVVAFVGGMGVAASIMVGARLGADKLEEAKQNARWQLGYVAFMGVFSVIVMIAVIPLINSIYGFTADTQAILAVIMIVQALSLPFSFLATNIVFVTRSGGFAKSALLINNLPYLVIKIPLVVVFIFIAPDAFTTSAFYQTLFGNIAASDGLIIFVFILDRLVEVVRFIIGIIVYKKANWVQSFASKKEDKQLVHQ